MTQAAEPVEINRSRSTYFLKAAVAVLVVVGCVVWAVTGAAETGSDRFLAWLGIALLGPAVFFVYLGVNPRPAIVIDSSGIKGAGVRHVAWDDVERMFVVEKSIEGVPTKSLLRLELVQGRRAAPATGAHVFRLGGNVAKRGVVKFSIENLVLTADAVVAEVERLSGRTVEQSKPNWRDLVPGLPRKTRPL